MWFSAFFAVIEIRTPVVSSGRWNNNVVFDAALFYTKKKKWYILESQFLNPKIKTADALLFARMSNRELLLLYFDADIRLLKWFELKRYIRLVPCLSYCESNVFRNMNFIGWTVYKSIYQSTFFILQMLRVAVFVVLVVIVCDVMGDDFSEFNSYNSDFFKTIMKIKIPPDFHLWSPVTSRKSYWGSADKMLVWLV